MFSPTAPSCAVRGVPASRRRFTPRLLAPVLVVATLAAAGCSSTAEQDPVTVTEVVGATTPRTTQPPAVTRPSTPTADPSTPETSADATEPDTGTSAPVDTPTTRSSADTSSRTSTSRSTSSAGTAGHPTVNAPDASPDTPGPETGPPCATNATYVDEQPTGLRSDVVTGWRSIEKAANADGVIVCLNDGKRSRAQQQAQYDEYEKQYGKEVADQLVLPPSKSAHVIGNAIDVQPQAAYQWLQATKGSLGFCRIYDNEPWHFEYDVAYFTQGCPARLPKPQR